MIVRLKTINFLICLKNYVVDFIKYLFTIDEEKIYLILWSFLSSMFSFFLGAMLFDSLKNVIIATLLGPTIVYCYGFFSTTFYSSTYHRLKSNRKNENSYAIIKNKKAIEKEKENRHKNKITKVNQQKISHVFDENFNFVSTFNDNKLIALFTNYQQQLCLVLAKNDKEIKQINKLEDILNNGKSILESSSKQLIQDNQKEVHSFYQENLRTHLEKQMNYNKEQYNIEIVKDKESYKNDIEKLFD